MRRTTKPRRAREIVVVTAVTAIALALPLGAPLYAAVYPGPDAATLSAALAKANLDASFDSPEEVTQFETAKFSATIIYATAIDPSLPTVRVAWSNEAVLSADDGEFHIEPTSASRQFLDAGTERPEGGYALTWTWDVTPLVAGERTITLSIIPAVVVEGEPVPGTGNINEPVRVSVDVHPVMRDFQDVLTAARSMEIVVPEEMSVGREYDISASMSLAGHGDTVSADIGVEPAADSAAVRIVEVEAAAPASRFSPGQTGGKIVRHWRVIPDEPGKVSLVFTASVEGHAGVEDLRESVPVSASARAIQQPSFWDRLQQPVLYVAPFVALAGGIVGLWAALKKRKSAGADAEGRSDHTASGHTAT